MILGILGGMGPEATYDLFRKIVDRTQAYCDQEHLHIIVDNNTQIPDRTAHICSQGKDPSVYMIRSAIKLELMGANYIAIACHTAHYYYDEIAKFTNARLIHMIEEVAKYCKEKYPNTKEYLLLATEGTYKSKIYKKTFSKYGYEIIEPEDRDKKQIMDWIYGVKSSIVNTTKEEFKGLVEKYIRGKSIPIILGCTELPILVDKLSIENKMYIDPTIILADSCIELAKGEGEE